MKQAQDERIRLLKEEIEKLEDKLNSETMKLGSATEIIGQLCVLLIQNNIKVEIK